MASDFVRIREVLDGLGVRIGLGRSGDTGLIWSRWHEVVGHTIAGHAEPTSLREGVLRVRAESPAWAAELGYLAGDIKARANDLIGRPAVTGVRVWTGPGRITPPALSRAGGPEESRAARRASDDPGVAFERAQEAWKRRHSKEDARPPPRAP